MCRRTKFGGFIGKKGKTLEEGDDPSFGDAYCFVAIERHTKLVLNFALGKRNQATTDVFIEGLRAATSPQGFQITTDGFAPYVSAIDTTLSDRVDFAQLIEVYRASPEGERRYSPAESRQRESHVSAAPIRPASAPAIWSARISPCGCRSSAWPG